MAVTFRSVGLSPGAGSTNCIIVKPAGLTVGDLMIAHVVNDRDLVWSPPDGSWTEIRQDNDGNAVTSGLFWKIAEAADVAASDFTFTMPSGEQQRGAISAWTGHDSITPINANNGQFNASSTTVTSPGITPSVSDTEILFFVGGSSNKNCSGYAITTDNPASWDEEYDNTYSINCMLSMAHAPRPETSATGNGTATLSGATENTGQLVAIAPALALGCSACSKMVAAFII